MLNSLVAKNLGLQESRRSAQPDMFYQSLEVHVARYHEVLHVSDPREMTSMFIKGYWKMFTNKKLENVQEVEAMQI